MNPLKTVTRQIVTTSLLSLMLPIVQMPITHALPMLGNEQLTRPTSLLIASLSNNNSKLKEISLGEQLALISQPSVVQIIDGYVGEIYWPGSQLRPQKKTYRVTCGGTGSGFFVSSDGYIVTNAHVTELAHKGDSTGQQCLFRDFLKQFVEDFGQLSDQQDLDFVRNNAQMTSAKPIRLVITPDGSKYTFDLKSYGASAGHGKDVAVIKIQIENAPILKLADSDTVRTLEHITAVGYPGAGIVPNSPDSSMVATLTDGTISAIKHTEDGSALLQISAPVTHGSSGGPVLNNQGEVIGIVTFGGTDGKGNAVSGISFAVASNTVKEFVKQAGANNELGTIDKLYQEGLFYFQQGNFFQALDKFEQVKKLFPQHSEIPALLQHVNENIEAIKVEANDFYQQGLTFAEKGEYRQALDRFEQVKQLYPQHPQVAEDILIVKDKIAFIDFLRWSIPLGLTSLAGTAGAIVVYRRRQHPQKDSLNSFETSSSTS